MKINKRGAVAGLFKWFPRFFVMIIVSVFFVIVMNSYMNEDWEKLHDVEVTVLSAVLRHRCLVGDDANVVDLAKVSDAQLVDCYRKESLGYAIAVEDRSGKTVAAASVMSDDQKTFFPICLPSIASPYKCSTRKEYIVYKSGVERLPGVLVTRVINYVG